MPAAPTIACPTAAGRPVTAAVGRPPPAAVRCVVPVWGYPYVRQFLEVGLPTWLAPGNLPALAAALPTELVLLTGRDDEPFLRAHPTIRRLSELCTVAIRPIDHLITGSNHSTTITLAYAEAIRAEGSAMMDTCFFLLVADYIVADGAFGSALRRMMGGASGVLTGNFQVSQEEAEPWLADRLAAVSDGLSLSPRELMRWALVHLHPATVANIVNYPLTSNLHTNRLFWRVDGETLLGRFFLMHVLCIRPELTDFVIGASFDYSFIPEMCPSGAVETIGDSDEYLVIEMQPRSHESKLLRPGPLKPAQLARSLREWTTARHRENARHSVLFHAGDVAPEALARIEAEADRFLSAAMQGRLPRQPQPHRDHPYWRGAIAAHKEATGRKLGDQEWRRVMGIFDPTGAGGRLNAWIIDRIRFAMFGRPPQVRRWHPRWPDLSLVLGKLAPVVGDPRRRLLMISDAPTIFTASLIDGGERVMRIRLTPFLGGVAESYRPFFGRFDLCLLELEENELRRADQLLDRVAPLMTPGGTVLVVVYNRRDKQVEGFADAVGQHAPRLLRPAAAQTIIQFVPATRFRFRVMVSMTHLARVARRRPATGIPLLLLTGWLLAPACLIANLLARPAGAAASGPGPRASSLVATLEMDAGAGRDAYLYSADRLARQAERARRGIPEPLRPGDAAVTAGRTVEPQYDRCSQLRDRYGLTSLGLMTSQVYHDDPRRLAILLARYKFVAKMMSGKRRVAEVGCGDAFGARIVAQEVDRVDAYDIDPLFVEDIKQRQSAAWPIEARIHDIVGGALPEAYDGIYSLDVIEHIGRADEHAYLDNLRRSLSDDGVLILGTPSLESQSHASPPSKVGHVNCKSGPALKALLQNYFAHVFVFSMNDEVVHTGFYPMAHYLLAICCGRK